MDPEYRETLKFETRQHKHKTCILQLICQKVEVDWERINMDSDKLTLGLFQQSELAMLRERIQPP